jgi:5-methylcytosine-specific restriction endonuclease McrA
MTADALKGWTLGLCANCDGTMDRYAHPSLFCGEYCRGYAKDIRYFRARSRDGKMADPDVAEALTIRMAFIVSGGYHAKARTVSPAPRAEVLAYGEGLCRSCHREPATEVDHICGDDGARENLQGLCDPCHNQKTASSLTPVGPAELLLRDAFLARVTSARAARASDDDQVWKGVWRPLMAQTRRWCTLASGGQPDDDQDGPTPTTATPSVTGPPGRSKTASTASTCRCSPAGTTDSDAARPVRGGSSP